MSDPPSPAPDRPDFEEEVWRAEVPLVRCGHRGYAGNEPFASPALGRFSPIVGADGARLPVLYAASSVRGALSETVFHDVLPGGTLDVTRLRDRQLSRLRAMRPLRLASLTSLGLKRLGLRRQQLIDSSPAAYPLTAAWAHAAHDDERGFDGLAWVSRMDDTARAVMLFGDRVTSADLVLDGPADDLDRGDGFDEVLAIAETLRVVVLGLPFT
ncbi:RES domain-containing protein [Calidifontibacter sp. DB0510]|uniref:RES domain-containing protein n=1 Tax=Metallococcus carri TaxID=1656884 RepID=A0A967B4L0_9MICO|nr:RES family NAD+ phosphorylase [Metallococcus carri]NHN57175.1 RES domain-containing protein [Metallococcus carri]NOP38022.1 RES family NAD+ phosphorylase [Calidifontibacter sp. DB2511S]